MAGVDMTSAIHGEYYMERWRVLLCFFQLERSRPYDILFIFHPCAAFLITINPFLIQNWWEQVPCMSGMSFLELLDD